MPRRGCYHRSEDLIGCICMCLLCTYVLREGICVGVVEFAAVLWYNAAISHEWYHQSVSILDQEMGLGLGLVFHSLFFLYFKYLLLVLLFMLRMAHKLQQMDHKVWWIPPLPPDGSRQLLLLTTPLCWDLCIHEPHRCRPYRQYYPTHWILAGQLLKTTHKLTMYFKYPQIHLQTPGRTAYEDMEYDCCVCICCCVAWCESYTGRLGGTQLHLYRTRWAYCKSV